MVSIRTAGRAATKDANDQLQARGVSTHVARTDHDSGLELRMLAYFVSTPAAKWTATITFCLFCARSSFLPARPRRAATFDTETTGLPDWFLSVQPYRLRHDGCIIARSRELFLPTQPCRLRLLERVNIPTNLHVSIRAARAGCDCSFITL